MSPQEKQRLEKLEKLVLALVRVENVEFIENLERRLQIVQLETTSKSLDSEDITINEAGASTKTALDDPDGWIKIGTNQNIPIYND